MRPWYLGIRLRYATARQASTESPFATSRQSQKRSPLGEAEKDLASNSWQASREGMLS
ncbi:MAG: hypothetical protein JW928_09780 [Candidatus Aureabacteria bacterium]|nr:hypothetical protein [Candidatus Auribacterota bacterium]